MLGGTKTSYKYSNVDPKYYIPIIRTQKGTNWFCNSVTDIKVGRQLTHVPDTTGGTKDLPDY